MEANAIDVKFTSTGAQQASGTAAQELVDDSRVTQCGAAAAGSSADPSGTTEAVDEGPSGKRTADTAADGEHAKDGQQPVEPAAKRARLGDEIDQDRSVDTPHSTAISPRGQQQQPLASLAASAPAASPGKGRVSPLPSARSPSTRRAGDVVLRLLVHDRSVAIIIGKGGSTVKAIQSSSGARIQVMPSVPGVDERVVVISTPEDPQEAVSGAEKALHAIQRRLILDVEPTAAAALDQVQQEQTPEPTATASSAAQDTETTAEQTGTVSTSPTPAAAAASASAAGGEGQQQQQEDLRAQQANPISDSTTAPAANNEPSAGCDAAGLAEDSHAAQASKEVPEGDSTPAQTAVAQADQPPAVGQTALQEAAAAPTDPAAVVQQEQAEPVTESEPAQQPEAAKATPPALEQKPAAAAAAAAIPALGGEAPAAPRARSVQHTARLLVSPSQASSLLTAGAAGLRAVKEQSTAFVKVLQPDESPYCALEGDRVTQVIGSAQQVFKAVILLGAHLRKHPATEWPGGLHAGLAARGGRRYGSRGHHRSPPPPPPPRPAYAGQYAPHPGYGYPPHGYGAAVPAYGTMPGYGAPAAPAGYRPPAPHGAYGAPPQAGPYDQYQNYSY